MFFISLLDDLSGISIKIRLLAHFSAAILTTSALATSVFQANGWLVPGWLIGAGGLIFIVWLTNLYNFMDGINGISAIEALSCCMAMTIILANSNAHGWQIFLLVSTAGACLGFLLWNFPKARLFLGDSGSAPLGYVFGALAIYSLTVRLELFFAWLIILGVFVVDASFTLSRRIVTGQPFLQPHRSHSYQKAADLMGSHTTVSLTVATINLLWLLPLAWIAITGLLPAGIAVVVAYVPLIALAWKLDAGRPKKPGEAIDDPGLH